MEQKFKICDIIQANSDKNFIIGGDFNTVLDPIMDRHPQPLQTLHNYRKILIQIMSTFELEDIWRIRNPEMLRYTHRQKMKSGLTHSRLDFFLTSRGLCYKIIESSIAPGMHSDHSMVFIKLSHGECQKRGKGLWKFNVSLLRDHEYVEKVKETVAKTYENNSHLNNKGLLWDLLGQKYAA